MVRIQAFALEPRALLVVRGGEPEYFKNVLREYSLLLHNYPDIIS